MTLLVPFGMRDGKLYEPLAVQNGKRCGCVCPSCSRQLVAKHAAKTPHFAHAPGEDCVSGLETAVHLAAKQLLAERMEIVLPPVPCTIPSGYGARATTFRLYGSRRAKLSDVRLEIWLDGIRPDLVAVENGKDLLIEILVTHKCDQQKIDFIRMKKLPAIEIDVSAARHSINFDTLKKLLFDFPGSGKWLHHPEAQEITERRLNELKASWDIRTAEDLAQQERITRYRELSPESKTARNLRRIGIDLRRAKELTDFVPWEDSFLGGRLPWQTAVLAYLANSHDQHLPGEDALPNFLNVEELLFWLSPLFEIRRKVQDAERIALWKYLQHLEKLGLIKRNRFNDKSYEIVSRPS